MKKQSYNWLNRLIERITRSDSSNNDYFMYYGYTVTLQSGMSDYVDVMVQDARGNYIFDFSFDFWTEKLCFDTYGEYDQRDIIINAFKRYYRVSVGWDAPWHEEMKNLKDSLSYEDNEAEDVQRIQAEIEALRMRKAA